MTKLLFLFTTLSTIAYVSATFSITDNSTTTDGTEPPFATTLSQWIVDTVSRKIVSIARFFNLKLRLVRFLVSLWTAENLVLFRNLLEEALRFGNFILSFLPESADDPVYWWVPALSEFINVSVGDAGPVTSTETTEEAAESEISEIVTNPSVFFNLPLSSTEIPSTDSNEVDRSKRLATPMEKRAADEEIEENQYKKEEILKKYEENIVTLDKLINAGRKY